MYVLINEPRGIVSQVGTLEEARKIRNSLEKKWNDHVFIFAEVESSGKVNQRVPRTKRLSVRR